MAPLNPRQFVGDASHEHQPLALPAEGGWRAGCACGWSKRRVEPNRAEAMVDARIHDERMGL